MDQWAELYCLLLEDYLWRLLRVRSMEDELLASDLLDRAPIHIVPTLVWQMGRKGDGCKPRERMSLALQGKWGGLWDAAHTSQRARLQRHQSHANSPPLALPHADRLRERASDALRAGVHRKALAFLRRSDEAPPALVDSDAALAQLAALHPGCTVARATSNHG